MRAFKVIVVLALLAAVGLVGFAYFGDMTPEQGGVSQPVAVPGAAANAD